MSFRVLIVDDEPPARERLRSMLAEAGDFEVAGEAGHGEQAIDLVDRLTPDIVLLDVRMPGIDGLEVARHLAALPAPPAVIFTTAFDEYALQAFDSEAVAYLLKPIRAEKLRAALAKAARLTRPQLQQVAAAAREPAHRMHIGVRGRDSSERFFRKLFGHEGELRTVHHCGCSPDPEPLAFCQIKQCLSFSISIGHGFLTPDMLAGQ